MPVEPQSTLDLGWQFYTFDELPNRLLLEILTLRQDVFVVEQDCAYPDIDGLDPQSAHLCGSVDGRILAYLRCLPPGLSWPASAIGRIVVHPDARGTSTGRELVRRGIEYNLQHWPDAAIEIGAQSYLLKFYGELGFEAVGEEYVEDGIPHFHMVYRG